MAKKKKLALLQKAKLECLDPDNDTRPEHSPYAGDTCALYFQSKGPLHIHRQLLSKSPKLASQSVSPFGRPSTLYVDDVSLDVGHILVHFLVTGDYECLKPQGDSPVEKNASEFATALRAYDAAESFQLPSLCELAEKEMQQLGGKLSLTSIIDIMEELGPASLQNPKAAVFLESRLQSFWECMTRPAADGLLSELGTPNTISRVILKSVAQFNSSEFLRKELEGVLEKEPAPAQAPEVEPQYEPPAADELPAVASEVGPQDEPPAGEVVEDPNLSAQSFSHCAIGGGFSAEQSFVFPNPDENTTPPKQVSDTKSPCTKASQLDNLFSAPLEPLDISEREKKGKKEKKAKKKAKKKATATGLSEFGQFPPAPPDDEPTPPSPDLAKTSNQDETPTSASSYSLLEDAIGDRVDDASATFLSSDEAHDQESQCARQPEHLTLNGGWKSCLNCRKLVQQFSRELMKA